YLVFENGFRLLFKLFGNRANIILYGRDEQVVSLFKKNLPQDRDLSLKNIDRLYDHSLENFLSQGADLHKTFFTLGKVSEKYLLTLGYGKLDPSEKHQMILETLGYLEQPRFYITKFEGKVILSLYNLGDVLSSHSSAIEALNHFYQAHYRYNHIEKLRQEVLQKIQGKIRSSEIFIARSSERITQLESGTPAEEIANIIMANLHTIPAGAEEVTLFDFYRNEDIRIKLKKDLSPQKNAELLYRKSRNRPLELARLKNNVEEIESGINALQKDKQQVEKSDQYKELNLYADKYIRKAEKKEPAAEEKFKTYEYQGFKIYVGRNAGNNDELTQKFAHKDDLWLHARDVAGSHVVVRHQSGKNFPRSVIEKAAQLAAWYSKRKNESLCPVICTTKKYVRKLKGAPKGAVKVEREDVLMVTPSDF
ncbi:MAG: NFACT RNA binding domain-containing protein, partial [Cytophagaceae bacterium]